MRMRSMCSTCSFASKVYKTYLGPDIPTSPSLARSPKSLSHEGESDAAGGRQTSLMSMQTQRGNLSYLWARPESLLKANLINFRKGWDA